MEGWSFGHLSPFVACGNGGRTGRHPSPMGYISSSQPITSSTPISPSDGIWIIDAHGKTVFANDSMAQMLGTTTADLRGQDSFQHVFAEDMAAAQRLFSSKQAGSSVPFHFRLRRTDGTAIWVDVQGTPMHNASGEFLGIVGTFTVSDVEEWKGGRRCLAGGKHDTTAGSSRRSSLDGSEKADSLRE